MARVTHASSLSALAFSFRDGPADALGPVFDIDAKGWARRRGIELECGGEKDWLDRESFFFSLDLLSLSLFQSSWLSLLSRSLFLDPEGPLY